MLLHWCIIYHSFICQMVFGDGKENKWPYKNHVWSSSSPRPGMSPILTHVLLLVSPEQRLTAQCLIELLTVSCGVGCWCHVFLLRVLEQHSLSKDQWEDRIQGWHEEHRSMLKWVTADQHFDLFILSCCLSYRSDIKIRIIQWMSVLLLSRIWGKDIIN